MTTLLGLAETKGAEEVLIGGKSVTSLGAHFKRTVDLDHKQKRNKRPKRKKTAAI